VGNKKVGKREGGWLPHTQETVVSHTHGVWKETGRNLPEVRV